MKIVNVEEFFFPQAGYQINLLSKYLAKLNNDVVIVSTETTKLPKHLKFFFGNDDINRLDQLFEETHNVRVIRRPVYGYFNRKNFFKFGFIKYINTLFFIKKVLKPDILFVHGNDTIFGIVSIFFSKWLDFPLIFDNHMLEIATLEDPLRHIFRLFYRLFITPLVKKRRFKIIRTQDDEYVERHLHIPLSQSPYISYGTDMQIFKPDCKEKKTFREKLLIDDNDFVIIYTGKLYSSKGGLFLAQAFEKRFMNTKAKNVILLIVGNIEDDEYGRKIINLLNNSENRILNFKTQPYIELPKFYQCADLCVFPKQCSLSFFDAQASGLPVIAEDININIERLSYDNGFTFIQGDINDFRNQILNCINLKDEEFDKMKVCSIEYIRNNNNIEEISKEYLDLFNNEVTKKKHPKF